MNFQDVVKKRIDAQVEGTDKKSPFFSIEEFDAMFVEYQSADMELDAMGINSHATEHAAEGEVPIVLTLADRLKLLTAERKQISSLADESIDLLNDILNLFRSGLSFERIGPIDARCEEMLPKQYEFSNHRGWDEVTESLPPEQLGATMQFIALPPIGTEVRLVVDKSFEEDGVRYELPIGTLVQIAEYAREYAERNKVIVEAWKDGKEYCQFIVAVSELDWETV